MEDRERTIVILTGGSVELDFLKQELAAQSYDMLVCADSGLEPCYQLGLRPDVMLGDYDSVKDEVYQYYRDMGIELYSFPSRKDDTDTELAVRYAIEHHGTKLILYGATGTRLDHTLANLSLLRMGLLADVKMELRDAHNRIRLLQGGRLELKRTGQFGDYVSLVPLSEQVKGVCLTGFRYPLWNGVLTQGNSLGISNVIESETASVSVGEGILVVIESRD